LKTIIAVSGVFLVRKSSPIKSRVEEFPGGIPRKHPSGAIRAMRARSQSQDKHSGLLIAETGHTSPPIFFLPECLLLLTGNLFPPADQPWTFSTGYYLLI
jgi:hypothetical protein